jgi:hypothetical protein
MVRRMTAYLVTAIAVLLSSVVVPPKAQALPRDEVVINYYYCDWSLIAERYRACDGHWYSAGDPTAATYRETIQTACSTGESEGYTLEQVELGTGAWQPYTGGVSPYCQCIAQGAC